jgi:hypothetical protein
MGPQGWGGRCGVHKNSFPLPEIEPRAVQPVDPPYTDS